MNNNFRLKNTVWLNASEQGPLPNAALDAACRAIGLKVNPSLFRVSDFSDVPMQMKQTLARLINADDANDMVLGNSATYMVRLLAEGFPFEKGDEILVEQGDFPTDILSWLPLRKKGVKVLRINPQKVRLGVEDLAQRISPKTRLLCVSWVNPFNGHAIDLKAVADFCAKNHIIFCLNGTQAFGYMPIDVQQMPVDAVLGAGYKWLLGPYGTGFGWMKKSLAQRLNYNNIHWSAQSEADLNDMQSIGNLEWAKTGNFDVFGTANFFNFMTWKASIKYLLSIGIENIYTHNIGLARYLAENIDAKQYEIISPSDAQIPTAIVVVKARAGNAEIIQNTLMQHNIFVSLRQGNLRISPHIYNTPHEIGRLLNLLNSMK